MADESEPESKPITVSELIARSEGDDAFPRSESMSVRRARRGDEKTTAAGPTSSGMPSYRAPKSAEEPAPPRAVGASGMPGYSPVSRPDPGPEADAVTGIIPVVSDDPDADTGSLRAVSDEDFLADELPPTEYRTVAADSAPMMQVRSPETSPFEETASIPVVGDEPTPESGDADTIDPDTADADTRGDDDDADSGRDAESEPALTGWAARRAARAAKADRKAERKAARKAEKKAAAAETDGAELESDSSEFRAIDADTDESEETRRSPMLGWLAFAGELVLGLAVGAGLFWGFTELWKRYVYLALILAVVVIFAIVTFAHVLRKRDLPTTLLALGVGMVVTIGPLVILAAQP